jgi:hypothetical protein
LWGYSTIREWIMRKYLMGLILGKAASRLGRYAGKRIGRTGGDGRFGGMRKILLGAGIAAAASWLLGRRGR